MVFWWLGLVGTVGGVLALYILARSVPRLSGRFRSAMALLLAAAGGYLLWSTLTLVYGLAGVEITRPAWTVVPILFLVAGTTWMLSAFQWIRIIRDMGGDE